MDRGRRAWVNPTNNAVSGATQCNTCPDGLTSIKFGSVYEDCQSCEGLLAAADNPNIDIPGCSRTGGVVYVTVVETTPTGEMCGNGERTSSEDCDDGNTRNGDGCTSNCMIEKNWKCSGQGPNLPDRCYLACGDGKFDKGAETCDDGNQQDGDGCTALCYIETGWECTKVAGQLSRCDLLPVCGNQKREWDNLFAPEACDDGNLQDGDGCSAKCTIEENYVCTNFTYFVDSCCATLALCGNGIQDPCEECDDGNRRSNDGCNYECEIEKLYQCRDGCNGPLCHSEDKCDEVFIGRQTQKMDLDILRWLGMNGRFVESGFDVKTIDFLFEDEGDTFTAASSGIFFDQLPGPLETGILHMFTTHHALVSDSIGFKGSYGLRDSPMQLACIHCSGDKTLDWPWGTISEPAGMVADNSNCMFLLSGGSKLKDLDGLNLLIIVTVDHLAFQHDEVLIFSFNDFTRTFRKGTAVPVQLHMPVYSRIQFNAQSHLLDGATWDPLADPQGLRFKVTYKTIILTAEGRACQLSCMTPNYDEDCVQRKACASMSREINLDNVLGVTNLEADFGNTERGQRRFALDGQEQEQKSASPSTLRRDDASVEKLTLSLSGYAGTNQQQPCMFGQNTRQLLVVADNRIASWKGMNGAWSGKCSILPTCADKQGDDVDCVQDMDYELVSNQCSVHVDISGGVIREHRYNCRGQEKLAGVAHGIIISMGVTEQIVLQETNVALVYYRRGVLVWTKSSLGRPLGVKTPFYVSFGSTDEYEPLAGAWGMQLLLGHLGADPGAAIDRPAQRFSSRYGSCRRMDLKPSAAVVLMEPPDKEWLLNNGKAAQLLDLRRYESCNETLRKLQRLETSGECKPLIDILLYHDISTDIVLPQGICENPCLEEVQVLLQSSKSECSKSWKGKFTSGDFFRSRTYKKLYLASIASAYSKLMCLVNHHGDHCIKSIYHFSSLFEACSVFSVPTNAFAAPFSMETSDDKCPSACLEGLLQ